MLRVLGLDWSGFSVMGSYLVTIVDQAEIPLNPFEVSATLSVIRILLAVLTLFYISRVRIKLIYVATSSILRYFAKINYHSKGEFHPAQRYTFCPVSFGAWIVVLRLSMGQSLSITIFGEILTSWMSMAGMVLVYTGYSLGMAQVGEISIDSTTVIALVLLT